MACCEKCWNDAFRRLMVYGGTDKTQADFYRELIKERADNPCSPDEQKYGYNLTSPARKDKKA